MEDQEICTENAEAFEVREPSDYYYGFAHSHFSVFDETSSQEAWYREASNQNPLETILVQVAGDGNFNTIYELIPSGHGFFVGSRFKKQELKSPAGIILFRDPRHSGGLPPNAKSQIDQGEPAIILFQNSANQARTLDLSDYITQGEIINWAKILREIGSADTFTLSYTDERQRRQVSKLSAKPRVGWDEIDFISLMDFQTGIIPELQYLMHQGDRVVSIINVKEELERVKKFITRMPLRDLENIDNFAANSGTQGDMLRKIFYALTGTANSALYKDVYTLAQSFKATMNATIESMPLLGSHANIQETLSKLDLKIPKPYFYKKSYQSATLEEAELTRSISPDVIQHLRQVGHLGVFEVTCSPSLSHFEVESFRKILMSGLGRKCRAWRPRESGLARHASQLAFCSSRHCVA